MADPWFNLMHRANPDPGLHVFAFPYAGGSINSLRPLGDEIDPDINLHIASLPGRGPRFSETPCADINELVESMANSIEQTKPKQFVLYGHSMGGIMAFEVACKLRQRGSVKPEAFVVSGVRAPHLFGKPEDEHKHHLPREAFIDYLRELDGTPAEILEHPELLELMLPSLRADFKICDIYTYHDAPPLNIPIHALFGTEDHDVGKEGMLAWSEHTRAPFTFTEFSGDHFFLNDHWDGIAGILNRILHEKVKSPAASVFC